MMIIRKAQMAAFDAATEREFEKRLVRHVLALFPETAASPDEVSQRVRAAIQRADGYGLEAEKDVAQFVEYDFRAGASFERAPANTWILQILEDSKLSPRAKMPLIAAGWPHRPVGNGEPR